MLFVPDDRLGKMQSNTFQGRRVVATVAVFVGGDIEVILGDAWPKFLEEQKELLAKRDELAIEGGPVLVATVKMPTGGIVDQVNSPFEMDEKYVSETMTSRRTARSGSSLRPSDLKWRGKDLIPTGQGTKTFILSFPEKRMQSKPVKVEIENGRAIH